MDLHRWVVLGLCLFGALVVALHEGVPALGALGGGWGRRRRLARLKQDLELLALLEGSPVPLSMDDRALVATVRASIEAQVHRIFGDYRSALSPEEQKRLDAVKEGRYR